MTALKVGDRTLATYAYGENNGPLLTQTYANGAAVSFTYDNLGRTKTATYSDGRILTYVYNGEGNVHSITESGNGTTVTYLYTYDSLGRLINSQRKDGQTTTLFTHQTYNQYNQLAGQSWQMGDSAYAESYTYNDQDGSLNTMTTGLGDTLAMGYDGLRRLSTVDAAFDRTYTYRDLTDTQTTMQVSGLTYDIGDGFSFGYTYNVMGNIATYTAPDGEVITYTYDNQGQLLSAAGDTTYTYSYDTVGNLLTANGHVYTYGNADWKDLLTAFDGETLTYDASGNPTSYYNGTRWAMTWANGRSLTRAESYAGTVDFAYDLNGLRRTKTVGNVEHNYLYAGGKLLRETYGSNTLDFFYDATGTPYALKHNGTVYYYITNLQGDVIQIVDADGNTVASYEYDPYGKVISATGSMAEINPLRYRGYYYDSETGFYYLQSRYYDPTTCRFINADIVLSSQKRGLGYNMFTYCFGNPLNYTDIAGTDAIWIQEEYSAGGQGHSGLMVQDEEGNWFYFYWGPSSADEEEQNILKLLFGVPNDACYVEYRGRFSGRDIRSTDEVVAVVDDMFGDSPRNRSGKITDTIYLEGDYTETHEYLTSLCSQDGDGSKEYNLLTNNCVQQVLEALSKSDSGFNRIYAVYNGVQYELHYAFHPNYEYNYVRYRLLR